MSKKSLFTIFIFISLCLMPSSSSTKGHEPTLPLTAAAVSEWSNIFPDIARWSGLAASPTAIWPSTAAAATLMAPTQRLITFEELPVNSFISNQYQPYALFSSSPNFAPVTIGEFVTLDGSASARSKPNLLTRTGPAGPDYFADLVVDFPRTASNIRFAFTSLDSGSSVPIAKISVYTGANATPAVETIQGVGTANWLMINQISTYTNVRKIVIWDIKDFKGIGFDDFEFTAVDPPVAPTGLRASIVNGKPVLSWNTVSDATSYTVKRSTSSGTGYVVLNGTLQTTFTDNDSLAPGTSYFYVVSARNAGGDSPNSQPASILTAPVAPAILEVAKVDDKARLNWTPSVGAARYHVKRSTTTGSGYVTIRTLTAPTTTFDDPSELETDITYFYVVTAENATGESQPSNQVPLTLTSACGITPGQRKAPLIINDFGWSGTAEVTDKDGLVFKNIALNGRSMATMMSVPYFVVKTNKMESPVRGELTPTFNTQTVRVRLDREGAIKFNLMPFFGPRVAYIATYVVDRFTRSSKSCLRITQFYEVVGRSERGCELSDTVPCNRLRPMIMYEFNGRDGEFLESLNIPQRTQVKVNPSPRSTVTGNTTGVFRDCDNTFMLLPTGVLPFCGFEGVIFSKKDNPVEWEFHNAIVRNGKHTSHGWDNIHFTSSASRVKEPPHDPPTVLGGCPDCFHTHWRWGRDAAINAERKGRGKFGRGELLNIHASSNADVDIAVVRYKPNEVHPQDFNLLYRDTPHERIMHNARTHLSFPEEVVYWYSSTGRQQSDMFHLHEIFFNPNQGQRVGGTIQRGSAGGSAAPEASLATSSSDGPSSFVYEYLYQDGPTTFTEFVPSSVGPLPPGYVALNNTAYEIKTEAIISGNHVVSFQVNSVTDPNEFANLRVFYAEPDRFDPHKLAWLDRTILAPAPEAPNFSTRTISAQADGLGKFVVAKLAQVQPVKAADIAVAMTDSVDQIEADNNITYTVTITNNGPDNANGVGTSINLPHDVALISATPGTGGHCHEDEGDVYCKFGALQSGGTASVTVVANVFEGEERFPAEGKLLHATAFAGADEPDSNEANNMVTETTKALPSPNQRPRVTFEAPAPEAIFVGPANIELRAEASDGDGSVSRVEFYANGHLIGTDATAENTNRYSFNWNNVGFGTHILSARVVDNAGKIGVSQSINIQVNGPVAIEITAPAAASIIEPGTNVLLSARASGSAAAPVSKVEFFANGALIGTSSSPTGGQYSVNWANVERGAYSITAVATDANDVVSISREVKFTVTHRPLVSLLSPSDGTSFPASATIPIRASVSESDGASSVEFRANGELIGFGTPSGENEFSYTWHNVPNGFYSLSVVVKDTLGVLTSSPGVTIAVNSPGLTPGELIWFDDSVPLGARTFGNRDDWYWVDANPGPFLGAKAHQSRIANGFHQHGFEGANFKLPLNAGDRLYTYVFLTPGFKPQELMLEWRDENNWEHRAYWTDKEEGNWINLGVDGTASRRRMGAMPPEGRWVRLEVLAADVGLAGKLVNGMSFVLHGGRATFDRAGKISRPSEPPTEPADTPWFDEALPAGAVPNQRDDTWNWVTSNPSPFKGARAHQNFQGGTNDTTEYRSHFFTRATQTMRVDPGDVLYTYVFLDPNFKPDQLVLEWHDGSAWHRAYWGSSFVPLGRIGTESMRYMGDIPVAGSWVRLEVPAGYVGLEGKTVSGMAFGMNREGRRGVATWDETGKSTKPLTTPVAPLFATTPMFRYFHQSEGYSYFTSDKQGANLESGIKWFVHANQAAGTVPVYRLRNSTSRRYLFTTNLNVANSTWVLDRDMAVNDDGIAFYIYPNASTPGTVELFIHRGPLDYFFSTERSVNGMVREGVIGWVHPTRSIISPTHNLIDDPIFFVKQHYRDFLSREADEDGLAFWVNSYNECLSSDLACIETKRVNISAAFFLSIEFQQTGYFGYRFHKASYNVMPRRQQLFEDKNIIASGVVVHSEGWEQKLNENKAAFTDAWVKRPEFKAIYDNMPNDQYVDRLYANAGITPSQAERDALVGGLNANTETRASVLRKIVDSEAFFQKEHSPAFVLMQYFGYLQRNPDDPPDSDMRGFEFWLNKLNAHEGNFITAEMVKAFLLSIEYRARFGQPSAANSSAALIVGSNVSAKAGAVTGEFSYVSSEGALQTSSVYPWAVAPPPDGYTFFKNLAWKVSASSSTTPPYTLTLSVPWEVADPAEFANLRVFNLEGGVWVDRTILSPNSPAPDFAGRTISARVNLLSTVMLAHQGSSDISLTFTSPAAGATFNTPANINFNVSTYDPDNVIDKVQFYEDDRLLGEDSSAPYSFTWNGVGGSSHTITAKGWDNTGVAVASASVNFKVHDLPAVFISSPAQNAVFDAPANITVGAYANDSDGIKQVEFFQGATSLGVDTAAPYSVAWNNAPVGSYTLTAVTKDNLDATMTSPPITVTVRNLAPTIAIDAPANGAAVGNAPASITVNASAQDSNGIIKVEFFRGATSLGIDTTAPYGVTWNNVAVGTYSLTAKATDGLGAVATSEAVSVTVGNALPSVAIISPTNGSTVGNAPASITIQTTATDNEGVGKVEFYQGATKLGEDTTAPYSFTWSNVAVGTYSLTARATDTLNATATSAAVSVTVGNAPPSVSITSPAAGTNYTAGTGVVINANATDQEGVKKVEFFQGTTKLGEDLTAPYSFNWTNIATGTYSLTAKATDNLDSVATSDAVNISVGGALFTLFSDDFNDNAMDASKWYVTEPSSTSLVAERNQRLELTPATAFAVTAYNGYASVPFMDMTDTQVTVEVPQYAPSYGHETYFQLRSAASAYLLFGAGGGGLVLQDSATGSTGRTVITSYNTDQHRFWRFRHDAAADKILWETSSDGVAWDTQRSVTRPFAITSLQVQLLGGKYSGVTASPATAVLDNLKVESTLANTRPTVSITSPAAGTVFTAPAGATITATAADSDGSITRVEFFSGSGSLGVDTTAPYSVTVSNAAAGTYSLTARAIDNRGGITTSAPVSVIVNAPPSVSMTAPANGTTYTAPAGITLEASASDGDGTVNKVEFLQNGVLLATDTVAPYVHTWSGVAAGSYALTARATDNRGAVSNSAAVNVTVNAPNAAPNVSLTSPPAGSLFDAPATVNIQAAALDGDGSVASVEFFRNGVSVGTDTTAPYTFTLSNLPVGTYSLTAKATDNLGAATVSAAVNITVAAPSSLPNTDTIGVYTGSTFQLRISNTAGPANVTTVYGMPGWTPVVGDWDGNGTTTLGVYVPEASGQGFPGQSLFFLSNRLDYSYNDTAAVFGLPGDRPIAGDWDGNGTVTIGVYRPSEYKFYLRNSNTAGPADLVVALNAYSGDTPIAGDWDGDGVDTVGMHNSATATFYLRNTNTSGPLDVTVNFGNSGDIPVAGDWDGDGTTTVGSYKSSDATWYLRNSNTTGAADVVVQYGTAGNSIPVAGNWDGMRPVCCGDTVWFDDALPAGAVPAGINESWSWVHSSPIPFSGTLGHQSSINAGEHGHYFSAATSTLSVAPGDKLFSYVYLDPTNPPSEMMLEWNDGTWEHRAYWGANNILLGTDGTESRRYMGPLPPAGQWVRMEIPASQVGLEGRTLNGMAFRLYGGRATWDRAGKTTAPAASLIISEFRFRGAGGASDEFVELYNNSSSPATISATDGSGGWALVSSDGIPRFVIPDGTVVPARGHYLATGAGYSLGAYAPGDKSYSLDIPDNAGIALFNTANSYGFTSANRLDAVGFSSMTNELYREGAGLSPLGAADTEFSFARLLTSGTPQDSNNNVGDFMFLSPTGDSLGSSSLSWLGGTGPENLFSPRLSDSTMPMSMLDPAVSSSTAPNRLRLHCESTTDCNPTTAPLGTLTIRRQVTNNSGTTITSLRYRVINVTTLNSPGYVLGGGQADVRVLSSGNSTVALSNGSTVQVYGTPLEQPPGQPNGGGYNSSLRVPLPQGGLPPGASINVQFVVGVKQGGTFRFFITTEALP